MATSTEKIGEIKGILAKGVNTNKIGPMERAKLQAELNAIDMMPISTARNRRIEMLLQQLKNKGIE